MNSEALFDTALDAKVFEATKRFHYSDNSRNGTFTEEWLVKDMIRRNKLIKDPYFDYKLQQVMNSGDF